MYPNVNWDLSSYRLLLSLKIVVIILFLKANFTLGCCVCHFVKIELAQKFTILEFLKIPWVLNVFFS